MLEVNDNNSERHNELYRRGCAILKEIRQGGPRPNPSASEMAAVENGCQLLDQVLLLNPQNWAACWIQGTAFRNVNDWTRAYDAFSRAYAVNPNHIEVMREFSIAACESGHFDEAIDLARRAMSVSPRDAGLRANFAVFLQRAGRREEALAVIKEVLERDPKDMVALRAYQQISGRGSG